MTIHLPEDLEPSIRAEVLRGQFANESEMVVAAVRDFLRRRQEGRSSPAAPPSTKPIWEEILELTADVPDEEWDKLPRDLAEQHDHYIYGIPKRPVS